MIRVNVTENVSSIPLISQSIQSYNAETDMA